MKNLGKSGSFIAHCHLLDPDPHTISNSDLDPVGDLKYYTPVLRIRADPFSNHQLDQDPYSIRYADLDPASGNEL